MSNHQNIVNKIKSSIPILCFMIIGAVCGVYIAKLIDIMVEAEKSIMETILSVVILFIGMYIAIIIQIIIHEAGHLLFGQDIVFPLSVLVVLCG